VVDWSGGEGVRLKLVTTPMVVILHFHSSIPCKNFRDVVYCDLNMKVTLTCCVVIRNYCKDRGTLYA